MASNRQPPGFFSACSLKKAVWCSVSQRLTSLCLSPPLPSLSTALLSQACLSPQFNFKSIWDHIIFFCFVFFQLVTLESTCWIFLVIQTCCLNMPVSSRIRARCSVSRPFRGPFVVDVNCVGGFGGDDSQFSVSDHSFNLLWCCRKGQVFPLAVVWMTDVSRCERQSASSGALCADLHT